MGKIHHVGGVLEACVAAGAPLAGAHRVPGLHGGRAGHLRGAVAADYQADGREPGLHVQGHGRGVRANARALCVWRGDHFTIASTCSLVTKFSTENAVIWFPRSLNDAPT